MSGEYIADRGSVLSLEERKEIGAAVRWLEGFLLCGVYVSTAKFLKVGYSRQLFNTRQTIIKH